MLHALALAAVVVQQPAAVSARESQAAAIVYVSLNRERRHAGLPPLQLDANLNGAAYEHVADMARNNYFDHVSPSGQTPWDRIRAHNFFYAYAGENIALAGSGIQADRALFNSPPHRANILSPNFTRVGIAVMRSHDGRLLFVEDFGG